MEIAEIKERLSILTVLQHYNLQPDRNKRVNCPFHNDKTPSMQVYPETNTVFCFSSNCSLNGKAIDQIDFIMHKESCSKHEALNKAKGLLNHVDIKPINNTPIKEEPVNTEILSKIFNYFRNGFISRKDNKGRNYLQDRNLNVSKLENLGITIGYNSAQFHHRGRTSPEDMKACESAGLLLKSTNGSRTEFSYTPWASHCVIFPLVNESGVITGMYGRSIAKNTKNKHYYLKNSKGLFYYPKKDARRLIICESIIDFLSLYQIDELREQYDFLPIYGTNRLNDQHKRTIANLEQLQEIIFFLDGDKAGEEAIKKYSEELRKENPQAAISKVETPEEEDINSLLQGHEPEIFTHLLDTRKTLFSSSIETSNEKKKEQAAPEPAKLNTKNPEYITFTKDNLIISILGGVGLHPLDKLKVTLKIERTDSRSPLHSIRHSLDLYHDDQTEKLIRKASERLETGTKPMQLAIAELVQALEDYRMALTEAQKPRKEEQRILTENRKQKAISYLSRPKLLERTNEDIGRTGMTGEKANRLLMYLVFTSRLREQPLHIISLGASGTGKTYLQEKIGELIPENHKLEITMLSENAFYYFGQQELRHKLILIEDLDGAENVLYPLRELQSKKRISKTIPIKDSKGNLKTITLQVEGPICLAGTTTREKLYEDNANRSLLIYLDNSNEHKENIMGYQRKLSAGKINRQKEEELKEFFKDMQSVLKPVKVRNPFAEELKIPETVFKPLRTNSHYLAFIETITFYHQYQRETKTDTATGETYIETTLEDIEAANWLLKDVLLAKSDELTNACREFLETIKTLLDKAEKTSFYKHEIREQIRINPHNLKYYLSQLLQYGYIKIIGGNKYKQGYEYEITSRNEYAELTNNIENALDKALQRIKEKMQNSEKVMQLTEANQVN
jgi:DNA primase